MENLKINGADAFIAFFKAYVNEMGFKSMFSTMDSVHLLFAQFNSNLEEQGYSDEDIKQFYEAIISPLIKNQIK